MSHFLICFLGLSERPSKEQVSFNFMAAWGSLTILLFLQLRTMWLRKSSPKLHGIWCLLGRTSKSSLLISRQKLFRSWLRRLTLTLSKMIRILPWAVCSLKLSLPGTENVIQFCICRKLKSRGIDNAPDSLDVTSFESLQAPESLARSWDQRHVEGQSVVKNRDQIQGTEVVLFSYFLFL